MAAMRYVPYVSGNAAALGPRHKALFFLDVHFGAKNKGLRAVWQLWHYYLMFSED